MTELGHVTCYVDTPAGLAMVVGSSGGYMYRIDSSSNRITKLRQVRFSELGFRERNHLQEWIANQPDVLGEDLLIIQKEFDGFDETRERLDLLALDKNGNLVVIENKLDDSGRDVVWQCLKYASYCSTLSKAQVAEIYQRYLDRQGLDGDARRLICEFLGEDEFEDVVLNPGNDQRLIMVAGQFRKEVTSTVLWLLKHNVFLKCFKATPFQDGESLFLTIEQVIPLPEAEQLMIGISEKENEERVTERVQAVRHQIRKEFWQMVLSRLEEAGATLYSNVGPSRDSWLYAGSGLSGVLYTMIINHDELRVEFSLSRAQRDENKMMFDALCSERHEIERSFGAELDWRRLDEKKASIIGYAKSIQAHNKENWPEAVAWMVEHMGRLQRTFAPQVPRLRVLVRG
jgi:Predicted nuclease of the RecB family